MVVGFGASAVLLRRDLDGPTEITIPKKSNRSDQKSSLSRAFTSRRNKSNDVKSNDASEDVKLGRASSQRVGRPVSRSLISAPVTLLSTTNVLSFQAAAMSVAGPAPVRKITPSENRKDSSSSDGSSSTSSSGEESDSSALSINTSGTATDASSIENSPTTPEPEPNHLSCYFKPAVDTSSPNTSTTSPDQLCADSPTIPQRVPSHSKRAHERMHRARSLQRMMSPAPTVRNSTEMFSPIETVSEEPLPQDPSDNDLPQVAEAIEDVGPIILDAEAQEDAKAMAHLGLACFSGKDYQAELRLMVYHTFYAEDAVWI